MTSQQSTVIPGDSSGADTAGAVSTSTITIGGEDFAVDPRGGSLNYSFTFFNGNVNYGQTPFNLSIQYQQNAAGSYVGAFTDDNKHSHPYGVSAYLPTAEPNATEGNGSQLSDAGGIWDLNLPYLFISTSKVSKFYGSDQIAATLSLGDSSYQILLKMPSSSQSEYIKDYTASFIAAAQDSGPLYSVDGRLLTFGQGPQSHQILVQDKYGTRFLFAAAVLYGYEGINIYVPPPGPYNLLPDMDNLLVYRIINIFYANGQTLNFSYTDSAWTGKQQHTLSITDTIGNTIAALAWNDCTGTVSLTNQKGDLVPTHQLTLNPGDYRLRSVQDITTNRALNFAYVVNQKVPYSWQNQTSLASIKNAYTGYQTEITYQQFNSNHAYDAGCNQFSLAEIAVDTVTNTDNTGGLISHAHYDFGFSSDTPNFAMPQKSGKKTYASGLNHWLDNIFYHNKDSDGCSSSDRIEAIDLTYTTTITTKYQDPLRNRTQRKQFDALGRATQDSISNPVGILANTQYSYQSTPTELQSLSTFNNLSYSYGSPIATKSSVNIATLNGAIIGEAYEDADTIMLEKLQQYTYNAAGNPTLEISPLGQKTEYTYLPAEYTHPNNERLVTSIKTHSIGNNGASFVLESQTFESFAIAPSDGGLFMPQATLPTSNVETHFDAGSNSTYQYRTDTMGGYLGGYNYSDGINIGLNGILTLRGQEDNTGASDIARLQNQITADFTTLPGQTQPVLAISSCITGTTKAGQTTSMSRGGCLIHFMGYPLRQTNAFGQESLQTYDNIGRLISVTTLAGTAWSQTTSYAYDLPEDLILISDALYSRRQTDSYGNLHLQLFDARQRHIASFQTFNGAQQMQTAAYSYDDANNLISAMQYGWDYVRISNYFYSPGTQLLVARVPNDGLAEGCIFDALNGITFRFRYAPASSTTPTTIGQIYGPVNMRQVDNSSHLLLADGLIDADAANAALCGFDLVAISVNTPFITLKGNHWLLNTSMTAEPLLALYQAMAQLPQSDPPPGSTCNWLELNTYDYDEWYRQVSCTRYTFVNHGEGLTSTPALAITVNSKSFQTAERSITVTYPQGQAKTSSYNILNGLQTATLSVNGIRTSLGSFQHDGLGRILTYDDSLNGSQSTATYTTTGLLNSRSDAYGNTTTYTYDPVSFKLIQTSIAPAKGGESVVVTRQYDNHLNLICAQDDQGNTQQWFFDPSGLLGKRSICLGAVNPHCPLQTSFSYDAYGELIHVADPFLPYPEQTSDGCSMVQCNSSSHGFNIVRDDRGRIIELLAQSFHGVKRTFNFHPVTGLLVNDTLANLPSTFGCGDTGSLSLCTRYAYDNNLRTINKSITRSDANGADATAQFSQSYDPSNRVASRQRQDFQGNLLSECFSYDLQTGYLIGYANDGGSAAPFSATPGLGPINGATYSYDLYGNLLEVNLEAVGGSSVGALRRGYSYTWPDPDGTNPNPFRLLDIQETITQNGTNSQDSGSFYYDQAGNVFRDGSGRSFTYDAHGLIHSIQRADQQTETFVRDGLGRIVQRNAPWLDGAVHDFGRARYLESSQLWQARFFGGTACCVGTLNNATPTSVNPVVEQPAFWTIEDLGRQAVNTLSYGGNDAGFLLLNATSHLPYGVATNLQDPDSGYPETINDPGAYPESVMGTAQGADVGTGLLILGGVRCFDPVLGRFLQWDGLSPFGKGGLNGYAYAGNDPVNFWDPSGHYRSAKSTRYGPKPLEAHHHSEGGFWDGFLAGFKHGVKAFYMTPYNYAKSFCMDLVHHHWVGALEMGFDVAVEVTVQEESGVLGTMVLQEFVIMSPSNIFSGKSPVKSSYSGGQRSSYEWGYGIGSQAGGLADSAALALVTLMIGVAADAATRFVEWASSDAASTEAAVDTNVSGDANTINRLRISEETNGHDDQINIGALQTDVEYAGQPNGGGSAAEPLSRTQRFFNALRKLPGELRKLPGKLPDLIYRKGILPHDPKDPFPWDENLTSRQRARAFVTVTSEGLNESRKFVTHLASWGGTSQPTGESSSGKQSSWRNSSTPPAEDQGLDPQHQHTASGQNSTPCLPPIPPPPDLPGR